MRTRVVHWGWEKVSCLERCPQFKSVLIEREVERGSTVSAFVMVSVVCMLYSMQTGLPFGFSVDGLIRY